MWVFQRQHPLQSLHQRHARTEPPKGLGHLAADGAGADHNQVLRQHLQAPDAFISQVIDAIQAGDGWNEGMSSRGQQDAARGQRGVADGQSTEIEEPGGVQVHVDPVGAQHFGRFLLVNSSDDLPDMSHHLLQIHNRLRRSQAVAVGGAHLVSDFGGLEQRLAGHAAGPGAVTADAVLLDQRDPRPQLHGKAGCGQAG